MPITTVAGIVRTHGRERPAAPAIQYEGRTLTFGELDERSNRLANALAAAGVGSRRPRRVPRQERLRVLRDDLRAVEAQRSQRRRELAAGADRDRAASSTIRTPRC